MLCVMDNALPNITSVFWSPVFCVMWVILVVVDRAGPVNWHARRLSGGPV